MLVWRLNVAENKLFTSSCEVPVIFARTEPNLVFLGKFQRKVPDMKFQGSPSSRSNVDTCGQTDGRTDGQNEVSTRFMRLRERA